MIYNLETFKKRLKALEVLLTEHNFILTEVQLTALEKGREEQQAPTTRVPGFLTFWVIIRRLYQFRNNLPCKGGITRVLSEMKREPSGSTDTTIRLRSFSPYSNFGIYTF